MKNKRYKEYRNDDGNKDSIDKKRLSRINEILKKFIKSFSKINHKDIPNSFKSDKKICIDEVKKVFN